MIAAAVKTMHAQKPRMGVGVSSSQTKNGIADDARHREQVREVERVLGERPATWLGSRLDVHPGPRVTRHFRRRHEHGALARESRSSPAVRSATRSRAERRVTSRPSQPATHSRRTSSGWPARRERWPARRTARAGRFRCPGAGRCARHRSRACALAGRLEREPPVLVGEGSSKPSSASSRTNARSSRSVKGTRRVTRRAIPGRAVRRRPRERPGCRCRRAPRFRPRRERADAARGWSPRPTTTRSASRRAANGRSSVARTRTAVAVTQDHPGRIARGEQRRRGRRLACDPRSRAPRAAGA